MILVTGHKGFIGGHVMSRLTATTGIDRKDGRSHDLALAHATLREVTTGAHGIIHLAAHADVRQNWDRADATELVERDNVVATLRLLEAARWSRSVKTFVFVSTGAVYAGSTKRFASESDVCIATSPYAASKLAGEAYVQAYAERFGWRWYCVRPAACFGSGYHHGHVADFVSQLKRSGKIHALDSGLVPRPAMHVEDLADALVALATGDHPSGIYNATNGTWSWRDTIVEMGLRGEYVTHEDKPSGWVGDSRGAVWDGHKLAAVCPPKRAINNGVRDALASCGWYL